MSDMLALRSGSCPCLDLHPTDLSAAGQDQAGHSIPVPVHFPAVISVISVITPGLS